MDRRILLPLIIALVVFLGSCAPPERDGELLWFATIWSGMSDHSRGTRCAIITSPATRNIRFINPRMPMTLDIDCWRE